MGSKLLVVEEQANSSKTIKESNLEEIEQDGHAIKRQKIT